MSDESKPVRLEEIDWRRLLPVINVFSSFRMAVHPAVLLPALALVLALAAGGKLWDFATGMLDKDRAYPGEVDAFVERTSDNFNTWRSVQPTQLVDQLHAFGSSVAIGKPFTREDAESADAVARLRGVINESFQIQHDRTVALMTPEYGTGDVWVSKPGKWKGDQVLAERLQDIETTRRGHLARLASMQPRGSFDASSRFVLDALDRMARASIQMRWGIDQIRPGGGDGTVDPSTVVGAAHDIVYILPTWLWAVHRWFLVSFGIFAVIVWAYFGGAISRIAAWRIARHEWLPMKQAFGYARRHACSAVLAPCIPLGLGAVFLGVIWLIGFVAFGLPYVHFAGDVVGGALYGLVLCFAMIVSLLLAGLVLGGGLLLPATAADGADAFDAVERGFGYLIGRPWQVICYNAAALFYGAITYLFLNVIAFLTLWIAHEVAGSGSAAMTATTTATGISNERFESIHHAPVPGRLAGDLDWWMSGAPSDWSGKVGSFLVALWVCLFVMALVAYVVGYFVCVQTWIYSLVRRSTDGTDLSEVYVERAVVTVTEAKPQAASAAASVGATQESTGEKKEEESGAGK